MLKQPYEKSGIWFAAAWIMVYVVLPGASPPKKGANPDEVAAGARNLGEAIKLLWMFRVPWDWAYTVGTVSDWIAQFSFGFYSIMLTSTIIGFVGNVLFKPRTWCSFCPMGTMTQMICKIKAKEKLW